MIRAYLSRLLGELIDERLAAAMTEGRRDAMAERPRVGPWVDQYGVDSLSLHDDRGHYMAGVSPIFESDRYSWSALRPFLPNATGDAPDKATAQAATLAVLETWCDVSAARTPVPVAEQASGAMLSAPVSPAGEGGRRSGR